MKLARLYGTIVTKKITLHECSKCVYFKPDTVSRATEMGLCLKFKNKNNPPEIVVHEYADTCRNSESLCGVHGKYWADSKSFVFNDITFKI